MKFTCTIDVNLPIEKTVELFQDVDNLHKWQDGFKGITHLSGKEGEPGAKSKILYDDGKRVIELEETIIENNLPEKFFSRYDHKHMSNTMEVNFQSLSDTSTRYISQVEYLQFNGLFIKIMARLFPNMFKKQVQKWMDQFKEFAESEEV